jgi:hypothetical protein
MGNLFDFEQSISQFEVELHRIAKRPVDLNNPDWAKELRQAAHPLNEVGIRSEVEALLMEIIQAYAQGDEETRSLIRSMFMKHETFSKMATIPDSLNTPEGFRNHLLLLSIRDQEPDTRDVMLNLHEMSVQARGAGINVEAIRREVAELSSDDDKYGMGTTRELLLPKR